MATTTVVVSAGIGIEILLARGVGDGAWLDDALNLLRTIRANRPAFSSTLIRLTKNGPSTLNDWVQVVWVETVPLGLASSHLDALSFSAEKALDAWLVGSASGVGLFLSRNGRLFTQRANDQVAFRSVGDLGRAPKRPERRCR